MRKFWVFVICLFLAYLPGYLGSIFTANTVQSDWYQSIKPAITPPSYVFPIVWNILFLLIAISLYLAWTRARKSEKNKVALAFGLNLFLNLIWSILYFGLRNPSLAFVEIILLEASIVWMIVVSWRVSRTAAYMLIPYLIWVSFASVLNFLSIQ